MVTKLLSMDGLGEKIASSLSILDMDRTWEVDKNKPENPDATYIQSGDLRIRIGYDWSDRDKLQVSGEYPRKWNGDEYIYRMGSVDDVPTIGVSFSRGPQAIAKEIKRRFLDRYVALHKEAMIRKTKEGLYIAFVQEAVDALSEAWGGEGSYQASVTDRDPTRGRVHLPYIDADSPHGDLHISGYRFTIKVELDGIPLWAAQELGEWFVKMKERARG